MLKYTHAHTHTHTHTHQVMRPLNPEEREQQHVPGVGEYGGTYSQKYCLSLRSIVNTPGRSLLRIRGRQHFCRRPPLRSHSHCHVWVCARVHVCVCVCVSVATCVRVRMRIRCYVRACACACACACEWLCVYPWPFVCLCVSVCARAYVVHTPTLTSAF